MTVWKVADVAQFLRVPKASVYEYARLGELPASKTGKHWMFTKETVEVWLEEKLFQSVHSQQGGKSHVRRKSKRGRSRQ